MRKIEYIVVHCSASRNGDARVTAREIDRWHKEKGWQRIGYHYVVEVDGNIEEGRPESMIGAHVEGFNANSIGICMVGTDQFKPAQWRALMAIVKEVQSRYPAAEVKGHRDFPGVKKACPCFDVADWLNADMEPRAENVLE